MALTPDERDRLVSLYEGRVAGYGLDDAYRQRWRTWCHRLLRHGGELVVPPREPEQDLDELLERAAVGGPRARLSPGANNACHTNVAIQWAHGECAAIATGYALSPDGLWRQHSWGVDADRGVVETTVERHAYVGIVLDPGVPTLRFAFSNASDEIEAFVAGGSARAGEVVAMMRAAAGDQSIVDEG